MTQGKRKCVVLGAGRFEKIALEGGDRTTGVTKARATAGFKLMF